MRSAAILLLLCPPALAQHVVTIQQNGPLTTHGFTEAEVRAAIEVGFGYFERNANIDIRWVSSGGQFKVRTAENHLGGFLYARGRLIGNQILLANGWSSAWNNPTGRGFNWQAFAGPAAIASIFAHELGHSPRFFGARHSADPCLMSINANAPDLCPSEISRLQSRYGAPRIKYQWTNPANRYDVTNDGRVTARDMLVIVNFMGSGGKYDASVKPKYFYDVTGNGQVNKLDVREVQRRLSTLRGVADGLR